MEAPVVPDDELVAQMKRRERRLKRDLEAGQGLMSFVLEERQPA
jgi:hypothetical protein